ncbi:MAG: chloride channel protein [Planctomycetota bacterium]
MTELTWFQRLFPAISFTGLGRRLVLGGLVGIVAGLGAIVFNLACSVAGHYFLDQGGGYRPATPPGEHEYFEHTETPLRIWLLPVLAAIGGLLSGLIVRKFAPEASGHGTDAAIEAYHEKGGRISSRVPIVKIIASALTIGSGGSGGREGPIAQIGAGFGSWLGDKLKLSARERRLLLASGMGAGVGAIFHAPLAGALFAAEIFYAEAEFESDALIPAAVSTIVGYSVFALHSGFEPLFETPAFSFENPLELLIYTALAIVVTLGAGLFVNIFYGIHDRCEKMSLPAGVLPMLGGALTGLIGVGLYFLLGDFRILDVLSFGYGTLQDGLLGAEGSTTAWLLLALAAGKMITTSISIGSGGSGGVFGPSMVIGGCLGGVVGLLGDEFFPQTVVHPGAYVLVGMAGFFAAAGKAPISTLVMVSEMTGNYRLVVPALWVSALAFLLGRPFRLYRSQVDTRLDSGAHRHELVVDLLADTKVQDLIDRGRLDTEIETVSPTMPLDAVVRLFTRTTQHYFPVMVDDALVAILSANDVRQMVEDREIGAVVIASDIANYDVVTLKPATDLESALQRFVSLDVDALPVIDPDDGRLLGMMSRRDLIRAYDEAKVAYKSRGTS